MPGNLEGEQKTELITLFPRVVLSLIILCSGLKTCICYSLTQHLLLNDIGFLHYY